MKVPTSTQRLAPSNRAIAAICWPWCAEICMPAWRILPVSSRSRRLSGVSRSQLAST
ncbi:MAG TPA: hypothetical protein VFB13_12995 [Reyranella sp.]|nr:hypothetical protein [Reyranella sp.]